MRFWDLAFLFVFATALPVFGSSVSVSCYPDTAPPPFYGGFPPPLPPPGLYASCNGLNPDVSRASASAQAYFSFSPIGGYNTLTLSASADAGFSGFGYGAVAQSGADFAEYLQAAGPLRAGYLQVSAGGGGSAVGFGIAGLNVSIPSGSSLYPPVLVAGNDSSSFPYRLYANPVPTVLGVPFLLSGTATASAYADFSDGHGYGGASANYSFRFFEADGTTPVVVSETPEPSTLLLGLPVLSALLLRRKV